MRKNGFIPIIIVVLIGIALSGTAAYISLTRTRKPIVPQTPSVETLRTPQAEQSNVPITSHQPFDERSACKKSCEETSQKSCRELKELCAGQAVTDANSCAEYYRRNRSIFDSSPCLFATGSDINLFGGEVPEGPGCRYTCFSGTSFTTIIESAGTPRTAPISSPSKKSLQTPSLPSALPPLTPLPSGVKAKYGFANWIGTGSDVYFYTLQFPPSWTFASESVGRDMTFSLQDGQWYTLPTGREAIPGSAENVDGILFFEKAHNETSPPGRPGMYNGVYLRDVADDFKEEVRKAILSQAGKTYFGYGNPEKIENTVFKKILDDSKTLGYYSEWDITDEIPNHPTLFFKEVRADFESKLEKPFQDLIASKTAMFKSITSVVARNIESDLFELIVSTVARGTPPPKVSPTPIVKPGPTRTPSEVARHLCDAAKPTCPSSSLMAELGVLYPRTVQVTSDGAYYKCVNLNTTFYDRNGNYVNDDCPDPGTWRSPMPFCNTVLPTIQFNAQDLCKANQ